MWPNQQIPADLVTFTGEILNGKFLKNFLCSVLKEYKMETFTAQNTVISPVSWYGNFVERHSFRSFETKFQHHEIRCDYGIFRWIDLKLAKQCFW